MARPPQPPRPPRLPVSPATIAAAVAAEGFCVLPGLLTPAEVEGIRAMLEDEDGPRKYAYRGTTKMASFPQPGDDVLGRLARSRRLHAVAAAAIGTTVKTIPTTSSTATAPTDVDTTQLHHVQAVFKEPQSSYAFAWHQDYGYHYHGAILQPRMCTLVVAVDPCLPENGGLEILARSHTCGRLDHRPKDSTTRQLTADPARMALLLAQPHRFPLRPLALQPGDAVVFHCLALHRSGPNASGTRRYALNITYNARDNLPVTLANAADPVPPPLPYAVVEEDAAVAVGGTAFDPARWGVPNIPRAIHVALEKFADGETEDLTEGVTAYEGYPTEDDDEVSEDEDTQESKERRTLEFFANSTTETREAVAYKCRALKLRFKVRPEGGLVVYAPGDEGPAKRREREKRGRV